MTVLVGVLCRDGVVVGSDSSATFAAGAGQSTIEQSTQKTFIVGPDMIFAGTGSVGLAQRFVHLLGNLRKDPTWLQHHSQDIALSISRRMIENMRQTFLVPGQLGALVAFACQDHFHLCEFALTDFQPEMKTDSGWFVSLGSGQMITDPFFGLMSRTLFRDSQPTLSEGILAAYWALANAILLNTGGINGPIQLAVLDRPGDGAPFQASMMEPDTLAENREAIQRIENHLYTYRKQLTAPLGSPPASETP